MAASSSPLPSPHRWRFYRAGGLDLVQLESADDFRNLRHLDQKLWTALACPVKGLELDEATLALIDTDNDSRIRAPELLAAVEWVCATLTDPGTLVQETDAVAVANLKDPARQESVREILRHLGKPEATAITLADVQEAVQVLATTRFNGDGVVTAASAADDAATATLINEVVGTVGGVPDRNGATGVDTARLSAFFDALGAYDTWLRQGEASAASVLPLGERTAAAAGAVAAVRAKVDDYFARCRLAAFDSRAVPALNRPEQDYVALAAGLFSASAHEVADLPLARIEAQQPLPLGDGVNPAWKDAIDALRRDAVEPLLGSGRTGLTEEDWKAVQERLAPYEAWQAAKPGGGVEALGIARIRQLLADSGGRAAVTALIEQDQRTAPQVAALADLEKLTRLHRDLHRLLRNFVSFADLFHPERLAIFQAGTLYLDRRSCELCIRVDAVNTLAPMSKIYIAYCNCTRVGEPPMLIAACFTQGDSDYLFVGRHGVFYDRRGRDWDAVITSIVDNPISIRQAFWSPYKKLVRMIEERVAKRAAAAEAASEARLEQFATATATVGQAAPGAPAPGAPAAPRRTDVGTVAAIGVAISGAISALTLIVGGILGLPWWQYPLVLLGIILVISGPPVLIAALKLRQRTIGPILDGNGWAINGRVHVNIPFGTSLTEAARLPPGAQRRRDDPYQERGFPWGWFITGLVVLAGLAIWVRWDHNRRGHYFWQPPPAESAPDAPAGEAENPSPPAPEAPAGESDAAAP